jgi:hypothetical protein
VCFAINRAGVGGYLDGLDRIWDSQSSIRWIGLDQFGRPLPIMNGESSPSSRLTPSSLCSKPGCRWTMFCMIPWLAAWRISPRLATLARLSAQVGSLMVPGREQN